MWTWCGLSRGLFNNWVLSSQVVCSGTTGIVSGTQFATSGADFVASQVAAGHVIWLESTDGAIAGAFEIVSVEDANAFDGVGTAG